MWQLVPIAQRHVSRARTLAPQATYTVKTSTVAIEGNEKLSGTARQQLTEKIDADVLPRPPEYLCDAGTAAASFASRGGLDTKVSVPTANEYVGVKCFCKSRRACVLWCCVVMWGSLICASLLAWRSYQLMYSTTFDVSELAVQETCPPATAASEVRVAVVFQCVHSDVVCESRHSRFASRFSQL